MDRIEEIEGRRLFGIDVDQYDQVRPAYPESVYSLMVSQGALFPGAAMLEIGPGSGIATRHLLEAGANPVTLVEPDERFTEPILRLCSLSSADVRILHCAFEDADLDSGCFDLIVAATAFHWLAPQTRVNKVARLLRPSGYVALLWNLFQDVHKSDDFHNATKPLLSRLATGPSGRADKLPFALDRVEREREFIGSGFFQLAAYLEAHWSLELTTDQVRSLYQSFSSIARLEAAERDLLLDRISQIAAVQFGGTVTRNMTTSMYLFRRQAGK